MEKEIERIVCSLDAQQCQQECEHKSDRTKCQFVTVYPKKLYEGINRIAKQSTAPDKETPDWLETDIRRGAEFGYTLAFQSPSSLPEEGEGVQIGSFNGKQSTPAVGKEDEQEKRIKELEDKHWIEKGVDSVKALTQPTPASVEEILEKSFNKNVKGKFGSSVGEFEEVKGENGYDWIYEAMTEYSSFQLEGKERAYGNLYNDFQKLCRTNEIYRDENKRYRDECHSLQDANDNYEKQLEESLLLYNNQTETILKLQSQLLQKEKNADKLTSFLDLIINSYPSDKTWLANGKEIFKQAEEIRERVTGEKMGVIKYEK